MKKIKFGELLEQYRGKHNDGTETDLLDSLEDWNVSYGKEEKTGRTIVYVLFEPSEE